MQTKKISILVLMCVFLSLCVFNVAFASRQDEFLQYYLASNAKTDSLIGYISMIATVFGVIVAIVVGVFSLRQYWVDKDIRSYRKEIKDQKNLIIEEIKATREKLEKETLEFSKCIKAGKVKIQEAQKELEKIEMSKNPPLKEVEQAKELIKKLNSQLDELKEGIAFKQGVLSNISTPSIINVDQPAIWADTFLLNKQCKACGKTYNSLALIDPNKCPNCGSLNI